MPWPGNYQRHKCRGHVPLARRPPRPEFQVGSRAELTSSTDSQPRAFQPLSQACLCSMINIAPHEGLMGRLNTNGIASHHNLLLLAGESRRCRGYKGHETPSRFLDFATGDL